MARTIYSARLWAQAAAGSTGTIIGPPVPNGFVWDIRDIAAINTTNQDGSLIPPVSFTLNHSFTIFKTPLAISLCGVAYHWEGRQILYPGDIWSATSRDGGWAWTVTGYQLTA